MSSDSESRLEQAEDDIAYLRRQVDLLTEILTQNDMTVGQLPNAVALAYAQYSSQGQQKYVSSDGNAYNTGQLILPSTGLLLVNAVTYTTIPGLTGSLGVLGNIATGHYRIRGQTIATTNVNGGQPEYKFVAGGGLTLSNMRFFIGECQIAGAATLLNTATLTTLGQVFTGVAMGANDRYTWFDGVVVVSAPGTISLQAAVSIAADTFNIVEFGTYMEITPIS